MNTKFQMPKIIETLIPFLAAGILIALVIGLLIMFSYVVVWGLIIGGILWLLSFLKDMLFPKPAATNKSKAKKQGRIIEHNDKK